MRRTPKEWLAHATYDKRGLQKTVLRIYQSLKAVESTLEGKTKEKKTGK